LPIGTVENVKSFRPDQIEKYYRDTICAEPRVIAIFGDVSLEQARAAAMKFTPRSRRGTREPNDAADVVRSTNAPTKPSINVTRVQVQKSDHPVAGIVIGFKSDSTYASDRRFALTIADCMCSGYGYPSGYIFDTLRGLGLAYEADANDVPGLNAKLSGCFVAYASCDPQKVNDVIDQMLVNIARLQASDSDAQQRDWFERSKRLIVTQEAIDDETPEAQAERAAVDELLGRGYDAQERFAARINEVTLEQVRDVARSSLRECVITVSTPAPDAVTRTTGVRNYDSFPPVDLAPRGVQHDAAGAGK
jgi:zinc protease